MTLDHHYQTRIATAALAVALVRTLGETDNTLVKQVWSAA